jgi:hypothetical protein
MLPSRVENSANDLDRHSDNVRPGRPAWQAPIAGAIVLTVVGLRLAYVQGQPITVEWLAGSAGVGALIGLLVALCDGPGPGTVIGRFLALVSPVTTLLPVVGVIFNLAAYATNRHHPGFHCILTRVTLVISLALSAAALWLL